MSESPKSRNCIFCGPTENQITREHVWPAWISEAIRGQFPGEKFTQRRTQADVVAAFWDAKQIDIVTKTVCDKCNNNWLGTFEKKQIKRILLDALTKGAAMTLLPAQQLLVAAWVYKMAILLEFTSPGRPRFFTEAERLAFRQTTSPPQNLAVWIAGYRFDGRFPAHSNVRLHTFIEAFGDKRELKVFINTITAGFVAMQVIAIRSAATGALLPVTELKFEFTEHGLQTRDQIWPANTHDVKWPPQYVLDNDELTELTEEWTRVPTQKQP